MSRRRPASSRLRRTSGRHSRSVSRRSRFPWSALTERGHSGAPAGAAFAGCFCSPSAQRPAARRRPRCPRWPNAADSIARFQDTQAQLQALRAQGAGGNGLTAPGGVPQAPSAGNGLIRGPIQQTPQNALMGASGRPVQAYQDPQSAIYAKLVASGMPPAQAAQQALAVEQQGGGVPPPNPPGFVPTGLAPGVAEAATSERGQGATLANALETEQAQIPQQMANLQELRAQLALARPGPVTSTLAHYGALWNELIGGGSPQAAAKMLADKGTSWVVQASSQHLGVPTDGKMELLLKGTPNTSITPQAAATATGMLMGNLDYLGAKGNAWAALQAAAGCKCRLHAIPAAVEPRRPTAAVSQVQRIDPRERAVYWKSLTPKSRAAFIQAAQYTGTLPEILKDMQGHG